MGEEDVITDKVEPVANGSTEIEKKTDVEENTETVPDSKGKQHDEVTEMEEDKADDEKVEAQQMDVDKEDVNEVKEDEKKAEDEEKAEEIEKAEEVEKAEEIEKADGMEEEEEKPEEVKEEKATKKRPRSKSSARKKGSNKKKENVGEEKEQKSPTEKKKKEPKTPVEKKEKEPTTPAASTLDRPVRERKSVERLVATIEKDSSREFLIEKGRGTALKDIPNVAYKISRKKAEDTFKLLHTILFGRRGKAAQVKTNILRFSGFVWHGNEEKQFIKIKEKLDKCVKEKLAEFCDVFDIPITKSTRKEDMVAKLLEFLVEPQATTSDLLAESEQGKKRKRVSKTASGSATPSKGSAKSQKKGEGSSKKGGEAKNSPPESEDESEKEKEEDINGAPERSDDEVSEHAESEEKGSEPEEGSDEDTEKPKKRAKSSAKKESSEKAKTKKITISKKANPPPKKAPAKSPSSRPKSASEETSAKKSSAKKKEEPIKKKEEPIKKSSTPKKSSPKESAGKKILKVKEKLKEAALNPSDDELRNAIYKILKEVDFNTSTFTDILKLLAKQFNMDLTSRKPTIKRIIQDELTKLADAEEEADEEEDEEDDSKTNEKKPSSVGVKA
ncbi:hypothetical protein ABFS82_08G169200 [Erythranthe guttata]